MKHLFLQKKTMTSLSVNINKVATLRNARGGNVPNLLEVTKDLQSFGAQGITIHPRPDQRHIRYDDAYALPDVVTTEFNIEGNPIPEFIEMVLKIKPDQVTLVPDANDVLTSNAGWDTLKNKEYLTPIISAFKEAGIRTSIFVDPVVEMIEGALSTGTDRIELYTESYAKEYHNDPQKAIAPYVAAAVKANALGIGINAGHDLSLDNLAFFAKNIPGLLEVSIGHALICESLYLGFENVIPMYLQRLSS
jgi:pyridoxine 5-phosphate synthase